MTDLDHSSDSLFKFPENVRIHPSSDIFDDRKNYVGLILYSTGDIYIKESNWILKYIPLRRGRRGYYIHGRLYYWAFQTWKPANTNFIGSGFSYLNREWKFISRTLNTPDRELNEIDQKRLQLIFDVLYINHRWLNMPPRSRIPYEYLVKMKEDNQNQNQVFIADPSFIHSHRKLHGCVKWINDKQRLGYIECLGLDRDLFIHSTSIQLNKMPDLYSDLNVEFNLVQKGDGWKAENIIAY